MSPLMWVLVAGGAWLLLSAYQQTRNVPEMDSVDDDQLSGPGDDELLHDRLRAVAVLNGCCKCQKSRDALQCIVACVLNPEAPDATPPEA